MIKIVFNFEYIHTYTCVTCNFFNMQILEYTLNGKYENCHKIDKNIYLRIFIVFI